MEILYAEFLLWFHGFQTNESYEALLHERFLNHPEQDILLELEMVSSHVLDTRGRFMRYWNYECFVFDADVFGKRLFAGLEKAYRSNKLPIDKFGTQCQWLWQDFSADFHLREPFWTLSYADECLSWGDEPQTRMLYEKAFAYYK